VDRSSSKRHASSSQLVLDRTARVPIGTHRNRRGKEGIGGCASFLDRCALSSSVNCEPSAPVFHRRYSLIQSPRYQGYPAEIRLIHSKSVDKGQTVGQQLGGTGIKHGLEETKPRLPPRGRSKLGPRDSFPHKNPKLVSLVVFRQNASRNSLLPAHRRRQSLQRAVASTVLRIVPQMERCQK
jgi:hypothetical protein